MSPNALQRNDDGFSFVQMIVTMVIGGILLTTVGFAAFQYIQTARETVLESNIRTAAEAVQNTLALNPNLRTTGDTGTSLLSRPGAASPALLSELTNAAGFAWTTTATAVVPATETDGWVFADTDTPNIVHIQMIEKAANAAATSAAEAGAAAVIPAAPKVRWLVDDRDAVRLQIRNEDGSWACALIVLRPDWNTTMAGGAPDEAEQATVEGNLRGIWYDAGANIPDDNGLHHCSPAYTGSAISFVTSATINGVLKAPDDFGNSRAEDGTVVTNDPLPESGAIWNIPGSGTGATAVLDRSLLQSVPDFESS